MAWLIFALIGVSGIAISNVIKRSLLKNEKSDAFAYSFVFQLMCAVLAGIFAFFHGFIMPPIQSLWINFLIMTFFFAAGTLFLFKAFQFAPASETTIAFSTRALWTIAAALLFLGESFNIQKAIGTILLFAGVLLVSFKKESAKINKGIAYALLAAVFWGTGFANDAYILRYSDALSYTALAFLLPALPLLIAKPKMLFEMRPFLQPRIFWKMLLLCVFYSMAVTADYYAFTIGGSASQISPILQSAVIVTVLLAAVFLGEKKNLPKKLLAAALATVGIILLA